jgi:hypothetical protein
LGRWGISWWTGHRWEDVVEAVSLVRSFSKLARLGGRIADKARGRIAECDTAEGEEQAVFSEARKKRIGR